LLLSPPQFWEVVILVIGICESVRISAGWNSLNAPATEQIKDDYEPGQIGFDPLGLFPADEEEAFALQTKELNNGRLAVRAALALRFRLRRGATKHPLTRVPSRLRLADDLHRRLRRAGGG
jgi:hypothetical protein